MKIYGIKTCGSVKKAMKFFKDNAIDFELVDFKKESVGCDKIEDWFQKTTVDTLFNNKGTKYRTLKLKDLNLDDEGKKQWLCKENMLIKRPVIEYNGDVIVGFDEENYTKIFT
jgi:Spx/MgsR family transcriptional regulator